jgi:HD-like signal output (HDOD) protein
MVNSIDLRASLSTALAGRSLPIIRKTAAQVIALLSNPNSKLETIANTTLHDQAFTARVLKVANSAYYQRRNDKITSVAQAITRTGYTAVRDIAVASEFAELVQKRLPNAVNLRRLLAKAFVAGHQASTVAHSGQLPEADGLFTSALLESLGGFAIAAYLPKVFLKIEQTLQLTGLPYDQAHEQATGLTPHEVTLIVVKALELPEDLLLAPPPPTVNAQSSGGERCQAVVHLTDTLAANFFGPESPQIVTHFETTFNRMVNVTGKSATDLEIVLADAFANALEFGKEVELDATCFALDGTTSPLTMRHAFLGMCIERAERRVGIGSGFGV